MNERMIYRTLLKLRLGLWLCIVDLLSALSSSFYHISYFPVGILSEKYMAKEFPTGILLAHKSSRLHLLRLTAGLKQTFVTKHCRFVPIDTSFTLSWDKFDLCKQFLWNQSNESSDSRNQIRQHFCTLLFCSLLHIFQEKQCTQHKFLHATMNCYKKCDSKSRRKKSLQCLSVW